MVVLPPEDGVSEAAQKGDSNWPKDEFGRHEVLSKVFWLIPLFIGLGGALILPRISSPAHRTVIAYCAQDQTYAEAIFRDFQKETGIKVRAVYDSEAVKTVGLANRLLAERSHPQCDVFWGNEEMRTRQMAAQRRARSCYKMRMIGNAQDAKVSIST